MQSSTSLVTGRERLPNHWVVFRLGHLGDVLLSTGVLDYLARTRGWDFVFATRKSFAEVFALAPHIRHVEALENEDLSTGAFAAWSRRMAGEYRGYGLLDLHGSLRSRLLSALWHGPVLRYDKKTLERRLFLLSGGRLFGEELRAGTVPQRYYLAVAGEGETPPSPQELRPRIRLSDTERATARGRLDALFGSGRAPVALHPFATHALKSWPAEHWRALAAMLDAKALPWIALGKGLPLFPGSPHDLSNATSLRESCALLSQCRLLVTGDSGPMHLAAAAGTPVLALFGPTTREWGFYPSGPRDHVLERDMPCRPCSLHGRKPCPRNGQCLSGISPEEVFNAVVSLL